MNQLFVTQPTLLPPPNTDATIMRMRGASSLHRLCLTAYKQSFRTSNLSCLLAPRHVSSSSYLSARSSSAGKQARTANQSKMAYYPQQSLTKQETEAFYVVRKGDLVAVYKTLSDCQAQVSASICDPSVGVYKGYSLQKETEEYLAGRGLRDALYTVTASDLNDGLFGNLVPCPFEQPDELASLADECTKEPSPLKEYRDLVGKHV